jgi:hypothetical protein
MSVLDRYCLKRLRFFREYYTPDKIAEIKERSMRRNNRGNVYAVFEHKNEIYIPRSDCYVSREAFKVLKELKKKEPGGKFVIFTELAAYHASLPFAGDLD